MDYIRYANVFAPEKVAAFNTLIIGAGATGTALSMQLAKLLPRMSIVDFDKIEPHNLSNQLAYGPDHVGKDKVDALHSQLRMISDADIEGVCAKVEGYMLRQANADVVAFCVDSIETRKVLFEGLMTAARPKVLLDLRLTARQASSYCVDLNRNDHKQGYINSLDFTDADVDDSEGGCTITRSIAATASMGASMATWQFMEWVAGSLQYNELHWLQDGWNMVKQSYDALSR